MHSEEAVNGIVANVHECLPRILSRDDMDSVLASRWPRYEPVAEYTALLAELVRLFNANWPLHSTHSGTYANLLDIFGANSSGNFVRVSLARLLNTTASHIQFNVTVQILEDLLLNKRWLLAAFADFSYYRGTDDSLSDDIEQFIQIIVSIPSRIANRTLGKHSKSMELERFSCILLFDILQTIEVINERGLSIDHKECGRIYYICQDEVIPASNDESFSNFSPRFLATLLGRIVLDFNNGRQSTVLPIAFEALLFNGRNEYASIEYASIVQPIIWCCPRDALHTVAWYVLNTNEPLQLLGDACTESADWKFILQTKYPLSVIASDYDRVQRNLIGYLAGTLTSAEQFSTLENVLTAWSSKATVTSQTFEQHFYHTKFIIMALRAFEQITDRAVRERYQLLIHNGVKHHMATLDYMTRAIGMITAEIVLNTLASHSETEAKLEFSYDDFPPNVLEIVNEIRELHTTDLRTPNAVTVTQQELLACLRAITNGADKITDTQKSLVPAQKIAAKRNVALDSDDDSDASDSGPPKPGPVIKNDPTAVDLLDSDDDDLTPYDMSKDVEQPDKIEFPKYLRDWCEAIVTTEEPLVFEHCLTNCAQLVEHQLPHDITTIGLDMLKILVCLEKKFHMDNFDSHRLTASVAVCVIRPKECAEYLCEQFHAPAGKYSHAVKLLMLDILGESAQQLTAWKSPDPQPVEPAAHKQAAIRKLTSSDEQTRQNAMQARQIIARRIEMKTRRRAHGTAATTASSTGRANPFADVAGSFFFPLVFGPGDSKTLQFKELNRQQQDVDDILLYQFLNTVTIIVHSAQNCPILRRIVPEVFTMASVLRFHVQPKIRLANMKMLGAVLWATSIELLTTHFVPHIRETQLWLLECLSPNIVKGERSEECRELAQHLLAVCDHLVNEING